MTITDVLKEFDNLDLTHEGWGTTTKDFIRQSFEIMLGEMELSVTEAPKDFGNFDKGQIFQAGQINVLVRLAALHNKFLEKDND